MVFERDGQDSSKNVLLTCRGFGAAELRPTAWGWRAPRVGPQPNHAKSALQGACSVLRRPLLVGAIRARDARHGIRTRWSTTFKPLAADRSRCWCNRASTDGVGMERAARWLTTQPRQVRAAWRGLRGPWSATPHCDTCARCAPQDFDALVKTFEIPWRQPVAVSVRSRLGRRHGDERAARWPAPQPRQVRVARHVLCGPSATTP